MLAGLLIAAAVAVAVAAQASAAAPRRQPGSGRADAGEAADPQAPAERLYATYCALCHGADARGYAADHAPSLVNPSFLAAADDQYLAKSIAYGRPGTAMAGYGTEVGGPLDPEAVRRLVAWLREQGPPAETLPTVARGDARRGAQVYAKDCQPCHGDRDTRGEGTHLANPVFLTQASDAFLRHAIVHGRPGTPMKAWAGRLSDSQIDDVVAHVRSFAGATVQAAAAPRLLSPPTGQEPLVVNPDGEAPSFTLRDGRFVPARQVAEALAAGRKLIVIDARSPSDWMRSHIPGSLSVPYYDFRRLDALDNDGTWVVTYCACPHHASGEVVDELRRRGFAHTAVIDEGILEWQRRGYPMVTAPGVTAPPAELPGTAGAGS